jgi:hypothetical protein
MTAVLTMNVIVIASAQETCRSGFVWREAFAGDHACVLPPTRAQAALDNSQAPARRQPGGGPYGPNTCIQGYVWRLATQTDLVCVTPEVRAQTARDNTEAGSRVAISVPPATAPQAGGYRTSEWSGWSRAAGIEYRYRWGWNPQDGRYASAVDAVFEMRNPSGQVWRGAARSVDCSQNTLSRSTDVVLQPHATLQVNFLTPNCGSRTNPSFRPNVVKSGRFD